MILPPNLNNRIFGILITIILFILVFLWLPDKNIFSNFLAILTVIVLMVISYWLLSKHIIPVIMINLCEFSVRWRLFAIGASLFAGLWLTLNIPLVTPPAEYTPFLPPIVIQSAYRLLAAAGIGLTALTLSVLAANRLVFPGKPTTSPKGMPLTLKYGLPIACVWLVYLLAFFPGMMSADSLDQWQQMLTGQYIDHHPAFHTLLIWLVTRLSLTPTAVALAQIVALSLTAAAWLAFMQAAGVPRAVVWAGAALFALTPVNGTMVNTLWKDIPFGIAVLGLTLMLARIVFSRGGWFSTWQAGAALGITAALVMLLRHDGLPLALGSLAAVLLAYFRQWKTWLLAAALCAVLYAGVRGPLYRAAGVQPSTTLAESSLSLYSMAAYARPGSSADVLLASLSPFSAEWSCSIRERIDPQWRDRDLDRSISFPQLAQNMFQRAPNVLLYFYRCARSMEWIVWDPYGEVRNASHVQVLVDANPYGIQHDSKIPALRDAIAQWVIRTSHDPSLNWFTWRPAFFLYLNLFIAALLILRNRDVRFGLISLPIVIQSITFSLLFAEPNFRYHYAVYLVSLISLPLLLAPALNKPQLSAAQPETAAVSGQPSQ